MNVKIYEMNREKLEQAMHLAMLETLKALVRRGELTEAEAEKFQSECAPLILTRESLMEKFAAWLFGKEGGSVKVVMCPLPSPSSEASTQETWK